MSVTRRAFASGVSLAALASACSPHDTARADNTVNDITQLNPIRVAQIIRPASIDELAALIAGNPGPISIGGGCFSQGGQTACDGALFVDMRGLNRIVSLDTENRALRVEAGGTWRQILEAIDPHNLSVKIMQSFSNFTVGGSLSVNCHGDYVGHGPVVDSVRSFKIVLADGSVKTVSRTENHDLFQAAIGGYGGVGVIAEVELDLVTNQRLERVVHRMNVAGYPAWHRANVLGRDDAVLHHAVLYPDAYTDIAAEVSSATDKPVTVPDRLAPIGKPSSFQRALLGVVTHAPFGHELHERYDPLIGQRPEVVWRNYEAAGDLLGFEPASRRRTTYALQEYFVPIARFSSFASNIGRILRDSNANILNVAIRHAHADNETLLAWAKGDVYSFVLYYAQGTSNAAKAGVHIWTQQLIDAVLAEGGGFYLPYQIHASRAQFLAAYPRAEAYFALKRRVDPTYKFRNRLWEAYYR